MEVKEKKIEITMIKIKIGKKEIELSVGEVKKLQCMLNELFGKEVIVQEVHHYSTYNYPSWYWNSPIPMHGGFTFQCSDNTGTLDYSYSANSNCLDITLI